MKKLLDPAELYLSALGTIAIASGFIYPVFAPKLVIPGWPAPEILVFERPREVAR